MNAQQQAQPVAVSILDREYLISCTPEERAGLIAAAAFIDGRMREIRNTARSATVDRIAVLAALNVAHEMLAGRDRTAQHEGALADEISALKHRLDGAMEALVPPR
jgi:cell division protein ZapA